MLTPMMTLIDADFNYRIFAARVPPNACYAEKLVLLAFPGETDARPSVVGQLVVDFDPPDKANFGDPIEWIEVEPENRRKGVGRRLWLAAEKVLGRTLDHDPVTDDGEAFADAMEKAGAQ